MSSEIPENVRTLLERHGLTSKENAWMHKQSGNWILKHKTLERLAVYEGVTFDDPIFMEMDGAGGNVAMVVKGRIGSRVEWSTGEASNMNSKGFYPYAMAEKRAKDRVILKLLGIHADVYSEEEAETFKDQKNLVNEDQLVEETKYKAETTAKKKELDQLVMDDSDSAYKKAMDIFTDAYIDKNEEVSNHALKLFPAIDIDAGFVNEQQERI